ncbi:MAG: NAD-dependent succinate-semialdehyde dehydrogenase [Bdellovibrio sp.]|nr:NAD-dependent succinate-semialdehyde dehydrogenase [Bdellovibrio sp.]
MSLFSTHNPASGDTLKTYQHLTWEQAEKVLHQAATDFQVWRKTSLAERALILTKLAGLLREHKAEFAQIMQQEMGKLIAEGKAEVEKCAVTCEFYAKEAAQMLAPQKATSSPYAHAEVSFQPLGVIFSIMPWNFPLWQVIRFAAPALMAGNVIVLKHADLTAGTAEIIDKIFAGLTDKIKLLRNLPLDHEVSAQVIADRNVQGVTFTGSSRGGKAVAIEAAKNLKKIVLELGGSDAYLILPDADLQAAAKSCAKVRLVNCGQSCVAGKRFFVHESVASEFLKYFTEAMKGADLAPLASARFKKQIVEQVEKLKAWGGKVTLGGTAPQMPGAFYPATIVVFEKHQPEVHGEEIFGPVASVFIVKSTDEALQLANSSPYGLGGGIFTQDIQRGKEIVEKELQAGFVVVNDFVKSDAGIPFGGIKESGYGRELGHFGILEFVNVKTVAVAGVQK